MNQQRRDALRITSILGLAVAAGLISPAEAFAAEDWNKNAFDSKTLAEALKALGAGTPANAKEVTLVAPDIAENGAVVPVGVASSLANVQQVAILVEKNPQPLAGNFILPAGTEAAVNTRVKMGQTSTVYALVKADGKWFAASKEIKVTLGGCGG